MIQTYLFFLSSLLFVTYNSQGQNIVVKPYLQDVEPTSLYIMWETDGSGLGFVDWGTSPFNLTQTTNSSQNLGAGSSQIHTAFINGLNPNTKYYYQIRTATNQLSFVYNFKTVPTKDSEAPIRLLAMSDMQRDGSNPNKFKEMIEQGSIPVLQSSGVLDLSEQVDAILIPGDLVATGGVYSEWEDYFFYSIR